MATIVKKIQALSEWLTFTLDTTIISPPVIKVKVRPINGIQSGDFLSTLPTGEIAFGSYMVDTAADAIREWDLTDSEGRPLPLSTDNRQGYLRLLLASRIVEDGETKDRDEAKDKYFAKEIFNYASDLDNFLKN